MYDQISADFRKVKFQFGATILPEFEEILRNNVGQNIKKNTFTSDLIGHNLGYVLGDEVLPSYIRHYNKPIQGSLLNLYNQITRCLL